MHTLQWLIDLFLHLDLHLHQLVSAYHIAAYAILFAVVFAETGLVVTPFLPGDSLLFAAGALAAAGSFRLEWLLALLIVAAILGDTVNFWLGSLAGTRIFARQSRFLNQSHLEKTRLFYEHYGALAIISGRFVPIVRTFVPFVAGIGEMRYSRFLTANIGGAVLWVSVCTGAGYVWGNLPFVKQNFGLVIVAVVAISVLPGLIQWARSRAALRRQLCPPASS